VKALNTGRRRGISQETEGDGRRRTDCETAISRLVQVRDRFVAGTGDVEIPGLSRGDEVEDVVTCRRIVSLQSQRGRERKERNAPFGETLTVPSPLSGADATQNIFCSLLRSR
jgi:hypothetical protein